METPRRRQTPADDLFERDDKHPGGTYSPLETLVRQTSLKGGWKVKGSQDVRAEQHSPSPTGSGQVHGRGLLGSASPSNQSYIPRVKGDVFKQDQLTPERGMPQRQVLHPPSPLVHAEFRDSVSTSYNGEGDSAVDMSFDASYRSRDSSDPLRLTSLLPTTEDDTIDRVRAEYQWDSASDTESPLDASMRGILPPSFRFEDNDNSSPTTGGRPLSDRSLVLPPSVKGLSLKNKSAGRSTPNSPAQMSFYSESSYSPVSKPPPPFPPSFPFRSAANSPAPPSAIPRTSLSDASEPSVYGDPEPPPPLPQASADADETTDFAATFQDSRHTNWTAPDPSRDEEDVDLGDVLERSVMGQWRTTRQSDLEPFAFRHYEGKGPPSAQPITEPQPASQSTVQQDDFLPSSDTSHPNINIVVTSEPSTSSHQGSSSTHSTSYQSSSPISSMASHYMSSHPYTSDTPQMNKPPQKIDEAPSVMQLPASRSAPVALSSPSSPAIAAIGLPAPATSQTTSSGNRAPSLVSANLGGRFNFSRPLRNHVLPASPPAPLPGTISTNYTDSGWSMTADASGVSSDSQALDDEDIAEEGPHIRESSNNDQSPSNTPQFRKQAQPSAWSKAVDFSLNQRPIAPRFNGAPGLRNDADSYRDSGSSGGSGNSESLYNLEQRFPAPPGSRTNSGLNPNVVSIDEGGSETETGETWTILGQGRRRLDDSSLPRNAASRGTAQQSRLSPNPNMRNPDLFASPRVAPRPPSPNTQTQQSPYLNVPSGGGMYSSPLAARSQPQFSSTRNDDRFAETAYSSMTARARPDPGVPRPAHSAAQGHELLRGVQQALASSATGQQTGTTLSTMKPTHLTPGTSSLMPNATTAPSNRAGSSLSLYSNYSFYGIPGSPTASSPAQTTVQLPDSPQGQQFSPTNSPNPSWRPGAQDLTSPSPVPRGRSPMNPRQNAQGHLTPVAASLAPSQLTRDGLYQPQYQVEQHHHRSFFKRKKSSRSTTTPQSFYRSTSFDSSHSQGLPQASTPEEYLQMGITYHERDQLALSAHCFEQSATLNGGCGFGMLMWGLSLRHGWGVKRDEKIGFAWVRQAADAAVGDLEGAVNGVEVDAVKNELVLAIFEVGQCYSKGWGVKEDKKLAVGYFQVAARLGDPDAQQELGFCYANGRGCKKNKKEAAKWYRAAAAQGVSTVGLTWIFKEKYDP